MATPGKKSAEEEQSSEESDDEEPAKPAATKGATPAKKTAEEESSEEESDEEEETAPKKGKSHLIARFFFYHAGIYFVPAYSMSTRFVCSMEINIFGTCNPVFACCAHRRTRRKQLQ